MIGWAWVLPAAWAGLHVIEEGQTVTVPLNTASGTVVSLPEPVRLVPPTSNVVVEPLQAQATGDRPSRKGDAPPPVMHFRVTVAMAGAPRPEMVTFVLASGLSVPVQFVPAGEAADSFAELQRPRRRVAAMGDFLGAERALLRSMLLDEAYRREVVDESWIYENVPELRWHLVRRHRGDGLVGYTFHVENLSRAPLRLNPTVLSVGRPNRAVLVQVDHERLADCRSVEQAERTEAEPPGTCRTVLRLVVRGETELARPRVDSPTDMPFITRSDDQRSR